MRILRTSFTLLLLMLYTCPAWAQQPDERSEIENLKKRIEALEAEKEKPKAPFVIEALANKLRLSGLLEVQASFAKVEGGDESSDLALATAQLEVEGFINESIAGHIIFLHEEGAEESVVVDEAAITLFCPGKFCSGRFSLAAGKLYVPFGRFNSFFISDPLTLELGETNNTILFLGWAITDFVVLKVGTFSGDTDTAGSNNTIDSLVASLEVTPVKGVTFGASYISDIAESNIGLVRDDPVLGNVYASSVPGASAFLSLSLGHFGLEGEYVAAIKRFERAVVAVGEELTGPRPQAWNLELAWIPDDRWQVALRGEGADDFQEDLSRYGATVSYGLFRNTVVALEYLWGEHQGVQNDEREHALTAQLALEF